MEENFIKCTNAWKISKILRDHMEKELKAALAAHGGGFSWYSEDEDYDCEDYNDDGYTDNVPLVMCNHKYAGPMDVKIRKAYIDSYGYVKVTAATNEYDDEVDIEFDDIVVSHIQYIIESIPVTDAVTDVSVPFSVEYRDDDKLYVDGELVQDLW